jgi:hypothetical protein
MRTWLRALAAGVPILVAGLAAGPEAATLRLLCTHRGEPLDDPTRARFYLYEPDQRDDYLAWGHGDRPARLPDGTYDLVIRYEDDQVVEETLRARVMLAGDVEERIDFGFAVARLTLEVTSGGRPIPTFAGSYAVYRSGQRDRPLIRKRPGDELRVQPGTYDIEVAYRDGTGLQTLWIDGYYLEGSRYETVELGTATAHLTLTLLDDGRPIPPQGGSWRVYRPGQRSGPLAERRSGERAGLEPGRYDVGVFYETERAHVERWLTDLELVEDQEREIEMMRATSTLRVDITGPVEHLGAAWCSVYAAGRRDAPVVTARGGEELPLDPGTYDIGCFLREGGLRAEAWFEKRRVAGRVELEAVLDPRPAYFRVLPRAGRLARRAGRESAVLFLLDSSANMRSGLGSRNLLQVAREGLVDLLEEFVGPDLVGLRVFGSAPSEGRRCGSSSLLVPPGRLDRRAMARALEPLHPLGEAALEDALRQAAADVPDGARSSIIVLTGGAESCSGDPCRTAARLVREGKIGQIHVIGLGIGRSQGGGLDCIGRYHPAASAEDLASALRDSLRRSATAEQGTISLFRAGRADEWIAGGVLGEKLGVTTGRYDVLVQDAERAFFWADVEISGYLEATAGRRAPQSR